MATPRVLIVEDDPGSRSALVALCRLFGLLPIGVATVAGALAELASAPPDFIVLDLMLPDGNGVEVLRCVQGERLPCRVAVCTGTSDGAMITAVRALQPERFIFKPIDVPELRAWLAS